MTKTIAQSMKSWLRRLISWASRARLAGFVLLVVVLSLFMSLSSKSPDAVRLWGLFLQLLGIAAAAIGIRDTRRMFGKPSFLQLVRNWFSAIPGFRQKPVHAEMSATASFGSSCSANVWAGTRPDASLEERVDAAERNLRQLEGRLNAAENDIATNHRDLSGKIREESDSRKEQDRLLHLRIEAASTDGLHLAAAGAFWLAIGVTMSTAPVELLKLSGAA